jgi:hypothetical protein
MKKDKIKPKTGMDSVNRCFNLTKHLDINIRIKLHLLWCQHCKALQKVTGVSAKCWWNPLDEDKEHAFCGANSDAVDAFISMMAETMQEAISDGEGGHFILTHWLKPQKRPDLVITDD